MSIITPERASSSADAPEPTSPNHQPSFAELGVPADLVSSLHARGIDAPFAIQTLTLADGCDGRDLSGRAPTGSGKTLAFGIPLAMRVSKAKPKRPTGLVLVPTRELAKQVCGELEWLGNGRRLRVAAVYGGAGFGPQFRALRKGVDVLVACPGRLADLLERREVDLGAVEVVVIDEADRMADMGFLPAVRELLDKTPDTRQTLLFSATLDGAVDTLVRNYQRNPVRHVLPENPAEPSLARHLWWRVERDERVELCANVIKNAGPTIVFCKTKHGSDAVLKKLNRLGVRAVVIHGNRSQGQRERALDDFTAGKVDALIATDVVARGIHVDDVACVLNFDLPHDEKDYVHRSGRTARAGAAGTVVTFVPRDQARTAIRLARAVGQRVDLEPPTSEDLASIAKLAPAAPARSPQSDPPAAPARERNLRSESKPAAPRDRNAGDRNARDRNRGTKPARANDRARQGAPNHSSQPSRPDSTGRGEIKWFDPRRGFGFITHGAESDLFVHQSEVQVKNRRIEEGEPVEFEIGPGRHGDEARNVRFVKR
ncbi:MAG: DEAD/DEAH box helicase [Acidimicrobiia bacterium]